MALADLWVAGIGLSAPGLPTWAESLPVLRGEASYVPAAVPPHQPQLLPPNERRRATPAIRQAFRAAEDATGDCGIDPAQLASVFASSDADLTIIHRISSALAEPARLISPTDFHNSVHNAASGYWSIATGSRQSSSTVSAYDASFAAGLLDAALLAVGDAVDTLLVAYDVPGPPVLNERRYFGCAASTAMVLCPHARAGAPRLTLALEAGTATALADPALQALQFDNPALRALPLLQRLACRETGSVRLEAPAGRVLRVDVAFD